MMEQRYRVHRGGALAVVFAIAALSLQPAGAQYADAASAAVVGMMTDLSTGQPVEGLVTLIAGHPDNLVWTVRARGGMFRFGDVLPGSAIVIARAAGFGPYFSELRVEAGKQSDVGIGLLREAATSGFVLDGNGCRPWTRASTSVTAGRCRAPGSSRR